jgi:CheY-like chemotaxis protein
MQKLNILIVEDGRSQREMLRDFLISEGHRVMEAENGEAAIKTVLNNHFDLILLDYKMPGMDGLEVLKEIKRINHEIDVAIITAYGTIKRPWRRSRWAPSITSPNRSSWMKYYSWWIEWRNAADSSGKMNS